MVVVPVVDLSKSHERKEVFCSAELIAVESATTVGRRTMRCGAAGLKLTLVAQCKGRERLLMKWR